MKKYLLYPDKNSTDHVSYEFDADNKLVAFRLEKQLNAEQFANFRRLLPYDLVAFHAMIDEWRQKNISFKLDEVPVDLSFERFYNAYAFLGGEKRNRIRAEKEYSRLADSEKIKAINYIKGYASQCKNSGIAMKHPDSYLKNKQWLD
jgi:hypothetical protein